MSRRVSIIHRNRLFRECLRKVLDSDIEYSVKDFDVGAQGICSDLIAFGPEIVLLDLALPVENVGNLVRDISDSMPTVKTLILVPNSARDLVVDTISAGAHGCVLEEASVAELRMAMDRVANGETFFSQPIVEAMFGRLAELGRTAPQPNQEAIQQLTKREREVLDLMAQRKTNREIGEALGVSVYTVKNHVHNILEKMQVGSRGEAVEQARQSRLV